MPWVRHVCAQLSCGFVVPFFCTTPERSSRTVCRMCIHLLQPNGAPITCCTGDCQTLARTCHRWSSCATTQKGSGTSPSSTSDVVDSCPARQNISSAPSVRSTALTRSGLSQALLHDDRLWSCKLRRDVVAEPSNRNDQVIKAPFGMRLRQRRGKILSRVLETVRR